MELRRDLLMYVVAQCNANKGGQYPNGWTRLNEDQLSGANELHTGGYIVAYPNNMDDKRTFPVVPTDLGVTTASTLVAQMQASFDAGPQPTSAVPQFQVKIETGIPLPPARARGFSASEGGSAVERFGFDKMNVGDCFHVPPSGNPDKPVHRTFSSVVSQACAKLHPKHFIIREVGADDPSGPGARVWRDADAQGERPTRKRKDKPAVAAAAATVAGAYTGFPAPGAPTAGAGGGFPAPGGLGAPEGGFGPGAAPAGFGGPAPEGFGNAPGFGGTPGGFGNGGGGFGQ